MQIIKILSSKKRKYYCKQMGLQMTTPVTLTRRQPKRNESKMSSKFRNSLKYVKNDIY